MTPEQRRAIFLQEIGIGPIWRQREKNAEPPVSGELGHQEATPAAPEMVSSAPVVATASLTAARVHAPASAAITHMDWQALREQVSGCIKCRLCEDRTQAVFGVGDEHAKWLFVGEGPGPQEDQRGEPFVGPAGKLLDNMLLAMGLRRGENTFIANIVKCRPTDPNGKDRPPAPDETAACMPYLERQIALIQPTVIVALGKTAAISLLGRDPATPVSTLRGVVHQHAGRPMIVTYHPAYLLRNLADKKKAWADLCLAMSTYARAE